MHLRGGAGLRFCWFVETCIPQRSALVREKELGSHFFFECESFLQPLELIGTLDPYAHDCSVIVSAGLPNNSSIVGRMVGKARC
jgi:hypothetical protein